jgi:hypothetical protein
MKTFRFPVLVFLVFLVRPSLSYAAVVLPTPVLNEQPPKVLPPSLKVRDIETRIGRKLTVKEKISLLILKKKIRAEGKKNPGQTALILGITGAALLIGSLFGVPFLIIGALASAIAAIVIGSVTRKAEPANKKAHAAVLLGWITLGLIGLGLILLAILLVSW